MNISLKTEPNSWLKWFAAFFILFPQFSFAVESGPNESTTKIFSNESICVASPWAYDSLGRLIGAAYMVISVRNDATDTLLDVSSTAASKVDIHDIVFEDGNMKMTPADNLTVSRDSPLLMKPHGLHIMLMGLNKPLESEMTIPLRLEFMHSGVIEVQVSVRNLGDEPPIHAMTCE